MNICFICRSQVIWQNDFDSEDCGYEKKGIVHFHTCPKCGSEYEVFEPEEAPNENGKE